MKIRTADAQRLEGQYIEQVKAALAGRGASEVAEIMQSVREHIDDALADAPGEEVSAVAMANVLERLGPPETFAIEDEGPDAAQPAILPAAPPPIAPVRPRLSGLAVAGALGLPVAILSAIAVAFATNLAAGLDWTTEGPGWEAFLVGVAVLLAGEILSIASLVAIRNSGGLLKGRSLAIAGIVEFPLVCVLLFGGLFWKSKPTAFPQGNIEPKPISITATSKLTVAKITIDMPGAWPDTMDSLIATDSQNLTIQEPDKATIDAVEGLKIPTQGGNNVRLGDIASIKVAKVADCIVQHY